MSGSHRRSVIRWRQGWIVLLALGVGGTAGGAGLDDGTRSHLAGLRSRGLYRLAADFCQHRLGTRGVAGEERTDLVLELARLRLEQARDLPRLQREEVWRNSAMELDGVLDQTPPLPRRVLIESARALLATEPAQDACWRARVAPWDATLRETARERHREAASRLRRLIDELSPKGSQAPTEASPAGLGLAQRRTLSAELRCRLAEGLAAVAELAPVGDPTRAATVSEALKWAKPIAESDDALDSVSRARRVCLQACRLQADLPALRRWLAVFQPRTADTGQLARLELEQLKGLTSLDQTDRSPAGTGPTGRVWEAWSRLLARDELPRELRGEIALERILALHALAVRAEAAVDPVGAPKPLSPQLEGLVSTIEAIRPQLEGIWLERLTGVEEWIAEELRLGVPLAAAVLAGRSAWQSGDWSLAEERLAVAARLALEQKLPEVAFEQGLLRCSAALKQAKWMAAADDLEQLLKTFPEDPRGAEVSLLRAYALGKQWQATGLPDQAAGYEEALRTHVGRFPREARTPDAEWMLGEFLAAQHRGSEALPHYAAVPPEHPRFREALRASAKVWLAIHAFPPGIGSTRLGHGSTDEGREQNPAGRDATTLRLRLGEALNRAGEPWSALDIELALALAELELERTPPGGEAALGWLNRVAQTWSELQAEPEGEAEGNRIGGAGSGQQAVGELEEPGSARSGVGARAVRLRVWALAGLGRFPEARQLFREHPDLEFDQTLRLLSALTHLPADNQGAPLTGLADLQRMVAESLQARAESLTPRQSDDLDRQMVEIYRRNAQSQQATVVYERLVQRHPRDAELLRDFARFLLTQSREEATRRGLQLLQSLDRLHPAGSVDWFENRLALAESLTRLERWGEAEKLLKKTRLLYPQLGTDEQRTRADSLLRHSQRGATGTPAR